MNKVIEKLKNYWYYYKVYVIVGVLVIAVAVYSFANSGQEEKFDRYAAVISSQYYTEEQINALRQALAKELGSCGLRVYRIALGAVNQDDATLAKLDLDLGRKLSDMLLIEQIDTFYEVTDGLKTSEPVPVAEIPYLAGLGFDGLWLVTRD